MKICTEVTPSSGSGLPSPTRLPSSSVRPRLAHRSSSGAPRPTQAVVLGGWARLDTGTPGSTGQRAVASPSSVAAGPVTTAEAGIGVTAEVHTHSGPPAAPLRSGSWAWEATGAGPVSGTCTEWPSGLSPSSSPEPASASASVCSPRTQSSLRKLHPSQPTASCLHPRSRGAPGEVRPYPTPYLCSPVFRRAQNRGPVWAPSPALRSP